MGCRVIKFVIKGACVARSDWGVKHMRNIFVALHVRDLLMLEVGGYGFSNCLSRS